MKRMLLDLLIVVLLTLVLALPACAEGGQVRGDNAQGSATQVQDPPPFQPQHPAARSHSCAGGFRRMLPASDFFDPEAVYIN